MKTKTLTLLILVLLTCACKQKEEVDPEDNPVETPLRGSVVTDQTIESQALGGPQHYAIYLPPGYDTSSVDYPVLYLLHGMWGSYLDWPSHGMSGITDNAIDWGSIAPMIIVMPDGLDAFYCNNYDGGDLLYEDYFIDEFIPEIESSYRIRANRENRAIAGLSMGGYGASFHAFKRPALFCCAYSMSGALDMGSSAPDLKIFIDAFTGDQLSQWPVYYMECGTEDFLVYQSNVDFDAYLTEKELVHIYLERPGSHDWTFWTACLPNALQVASAQFEQ